MMQEYANEGLVGARHRDLWEPEYDDRDLKQLRAIEWAMIRAGYNDRACVLRGIFVKKWQRIQAWRQ